MFYYRVALLLILATIVLGRRLPPSIRNGNMAKIQDYPFFAFLAFKDKMLKCGGAIIKTNIILTAAHCLDEKNFQVYAGINDKKDLLLQTPYQVSKIIRYPKYQPHKVEYDIGLAILEKHIKLGKTAQVINIATKSPEIGSQLTMIGFGKTNCVKLQRKRKDDACICKGEYCIQLRNAHTKLTNKKYELLYSKGQDQNSCYGDSGGPVIYKTTLVGVMASGKYRDCSGFDTHVNVAVYYDWIQKYMYMY